MFEHGMSMKADTNGGRMTLFAILVASGKSVAAAGRIAGVSRATGYRWAKQPNFRKRVQGIRHEAISQAAGSLSDSTVEASKTLRRLLRSNNEGIALAAARTILQASLKVREAVEIEDRVAQLEEKCRFENAKRQLRAAYTEVEAEQITEATDDA